MTREEILKMYKVENGIIKSPGKFEGEMVYAPYFYDLIMEGDGEIQEDGSSFVDFIEEDYKEFPELVGNDIAYINEDDNGFVWCEISKRERKE